MDSPIIAFGEEFVCGKVRKGKVIAARVAPIKPKTRTLREA